MPIHRTVLSVALVAMVALVVACATVSEVVTGRDLTCEATPDDICIRVADLAVRELSVMLQEGRPDAIVMTTVKVGAADCADLDVMVERTATRCWYVEGTYPDGYADIPITSSIAPGSIGTWVYQRPDGSLTLWQ